VTSAANVNEKMPQEYRPFVFIALRHCSTDNVSCMITLSVISQDVRFY
jgi:hypothetical protein